MKSAPTARIPAALLAAAVLAVAPLAAAARAGDDVTGLTADLEARRGRVVEALGRDGVMLLRSRRAARFSNDVHYPFREANDLYYLTGLNQPGSAVLVCGRPVGKFGKLVVFTPTSGRQPGYGFGNPRPSRAEVAARVGVPEGAIRPPRELDAILRQALALKGKGDKVSSARVFFYDWRGAARDGVGDDDTVQRIVRGLRRERKGRRRVKSPRPIIGPLRTIKSLYEIACIRRAIAATESGLRAAIRDMRPGWHEFEVAALIEYQYRRAGCEGMAFPSIVGSGANGCIPHYTLNRRKIPDGDLVLMDVGGDYRHYAADITRTVPVNGRFTKRQRALYELVLEAQRAGIRAVRPGAPFSAPDRAARAVIGKGLVRLGVVKRVRDSFRHFMHGTSHTLGMDVHDVGVARLAPGMVVTVEPGVYIPDEGIGIRIEDDVLVTEKGCTVLSEGVPKAADEIEALMAESGENGPPVGKPPKLGIGSPRPR